VSRHGTTHMTNDDPASAFYFFPSEGTRYGPMGRGTGRGVRGSAPAGDEGRWLSLRRGPSDDADI